RTRLGVVTHSHPVLSSPIPKISSSNGSGICPENRTRPDARDPSPFEPPIQSTPSESVNRQCTLPGGSPSAPASDFHAPFEKALRPFGVANQIVPSGVSSIAEIVFEARPSAIV